MKPFNVKERTEIIELNVTTISPSYPFGQLPNLREAAHITNIEVYDASQVTVSPKNKTVISNTVSKKSFLQLVALGGASEVLHTIPFTDLQKSNYPVPDINTQPIDWEKSGIYVPEQTGLNVNESFILKINYLKK